MKKRIPYILLALALIAVIFSLTPISAGAVNSVELQMCVSYDSETETHIFSLAEYDGKLYAGTYPNGKIYVYDGTSWVEAYATGETHVWSMAVYDGKLYAGTEPGGKVYVYDGTSWDLSFDSPEWHVNSLAAYDGKLYAGTWNKGLIYVYDGTTWELAVDLLTFLPGISYPDYRSHVFALQEYGGKLYAGTDVGPTPTDPPQPYEPGGLVFSYDGTSWDLAFDTGEEQVRSLGVYGGKLYAGTGWAGVIYDFDGTSWGVAYDSLAGSVDSLAVHSSNLYVGTGGAGVIYGFDGISWGIAFDSAEADVFSLASYGGNFYAGTSVEGRIYGPCAIAVEIDIKPGSDPNSINLGDHGLLPVAVLGGPTFDVYTIDLFKPITLGGTGVTSRGSAKAPKLAVSYEDVNGDGLMDLVAFFSVQDLVASGALHETTTELMLEAETTGGVPIWGIDSVRVVPPE